MKRNVTFAVVLLLATTSLFAATGSANAKARIGAPLIITAGNTLSFGTIFVTGGGSVSVGWDGALTTGGTGAKILATSDMTEASTWVSAADDPALGTFTVTGPPTSQLSYAVSVGASVLTFSGVCPDDSCTEMTLNPTIEDPSEPVGSGTTVFKVGGSLSVAATQGEGVYTGTYTITADYQ